MSSTVIFNLLLLLYPLLVYDLFITILIPWKRNKVLEVHILFLRILVAFVPYSILLSLTFKAVNAPILADPNVFYYLLVQSSYNAHCYLLPCLHVFVGPFPSIFLHFCLGKCYHSSWFNLWNWPWFPIQILISTCFVSLLEKSHSPNIVNIYSCVPQDVICKLLKDLFQHLSPYITMLAVAAQ